MKVGIVASCFDLLHAGHHLMLKEAREKCDVIIAFLQTDPTVDRPEKNKPIQSYEERYIQLSSVRYVRDIIKYTTEEELYNSIKVVRDSYMNHYRNYCGDNLGDVHLIRILGDDYIGKRFTGDDLISHTVYVDRSHGYSTTFLRNRVYEAEVAKRMSNDNHILNAIQ